MPAMRFNVIWPDGSEDSCYSPSTVITRYLQENTRYPLETFTRICDQALNEASQRVEQKYGYFCSSAMDQLSLIRNKAATFAQNDTPQVQVTRIVQQ